MSYYSIYEKYKWIKWSVRNRIKMSKSSSHVETSHEYYECVPCGYTARIDLSIGMCPLCGGRIGSEAGK